VVLLHYWYKRPKEVSLFTNFQISALSGLEEVSGISDRPGEKLKNKQEKSAPFGLSGYDQMKVESRGTALPNCKPLKSYLSRFAIILFKANF